MYSFPPAYYAFMIGKFDFPSIAFVLPRIALTSAADSLPNGSPFFHLKTADLTYGSGKRDTKSRRGSG